MMNPDDPDCGIVITIVMCAPFSFAFFRFAPLRIAFARLAPVRSAPSKSRELRSTPGHDVAGSIAQSADAETGKHNASAQATPAKLIRRE